MYLEECKYVNAKDITKIVGSIETEGELTPSAFGRENYKFKIRTKDGLVWVRLGWSHLNQLIALFGRDTTKWVGREVTLESVEVQLDDGKTVRTWKVQK